MIELTAPMGTTHERLQDWLTSEKSIDLTAVGRAHLTMVSTGPVTTLFEGDIPEADWVLLTGSFVQLHIGWSPR